MRAAVISDALAVPFAWGYDDGSGAVGPAPEDLNRRRVTQCALSRVCAVCAEPLGRPVVFLGTPLEDGRNAFHVPPMHAECAERVRAHEAADPTWRLVATAGFEFVRPGRDEVEDRPTFQPNSRLT